MIRVFELKAILEALDDNMEIKVRVYDGDANIIGDSDHSLDDEIETADYQEYYYLIARVD